MSRGPSPQNVGDGEVVFDFDAVFDPENYLYFYEEGLTEERAARELRFLVETLPLDAPKRILDLACGHGRHANRMAERGHSVVGVDRSGRFLAIAEADAKRRGVQVEYVRGDMREIAYSGEFDAVLLLFTAFGYFSDDQNGAVLANVARALKPDGAFCFDTLNRDVFLKALRPCAVTERDGNLMIDRVFFEVKTGRLTNRRIYIRDGRRTDAPFSVRLYSYTEIAALLGAAGLRIDAAYGDWDGQPFENESRRMIIVAGKATGG